MLAVKIGEKYTVDEWKKIMEEEGYQWKDFEPDPEGKKYANWVKNNRRKVIIEHLAWHIKSPLLVFYKPNPDYVPTPDHPLKGKGKFKAIYLHDAYPICEISIVEAEIINVNAKIKWLGGAPLNITQTTPSRLLKYDPDICNSLITMRNHELNCIQRWKMILDEHLLSEMPSEIATNTAKEDVS